MRTSIARHRGAAKLVLAASAALSTLASWPTNARAQIDVNPPLPNLMLLIDTSGSMEYLLPLSPTTGKPLLPGDPDPAASGSTCTPGTSVPDDKRTRWITLVEVLTGDVNNFSCQKITRDGAFAAEYKFQNVDPYDLNYHLPYHRALSSGCTMGPGTLDPGWDPNWKWYEWPTKPFYFHDYSSTSQACTTWSQANNGLLDTFRDRIRFSMMTFDPSIEGGTGALGSAPDAVSGMKGMWSYYRNWLSSGQAVQGQPAGCQVARDFEVGARNQAAPPWEGRLVPFPSYAAAQLEVNTVNDRIQQELIALRPYGATPIAGMMSDAYEYMTADGSTDPATQAPFGPKDDPYWKHGSGCRDMYALLLTDGEPNLDLRPYCGATSPPCPYRTSAEIAKDLYDNYRIKTIVVGVASDVAPKNTQPAPPPGLQCCDPNNPYWANSAYCQQPVDPTLSCCHAVKYSDPNGPAYCKNATGWLKTCCALAEIAYSGGSSDVLYANNKDDLKTQLAMVFSTIAKSQTTRAIPVFSSAGASVQGQNQNGTVAVSYQFGATFSVPPTGQVWFGHLLRQRYTCDLSQAGQPAKAQPVDPNQGDAFDVNLNSNDQLNQRQFFTVVNADPSGAINSGRTIRPNIQGVPTDGLAPVNTPVVTTTALANGSMFATNMGSYPKALNITGNLASCNTLFKTGNAGACATELLRWEVGEPPSKSGMPSRVGNAFGAIYHSTPAVLGPPNALLRDDSYAAFAVAQAKRPTMLYAATTDGQLHAFKVDATTGANNEIWSFFPPSVLPQLLGSYNQQAIVLDGAPVVTDVVYERKRGAAPDWSTVLVAGGGSAASGGFYYALDVTDPTKPKFLWQLSTNDSDVPLFGRSSGVPAVATVLLQDGQSDVREVAVALLPGGGATPVTCPANVGNNGPTARTTCNALSGAQASCPPLMTPTSPQFNARSQVRCWDPTKAAARSLTVVNLSTGEVLMNFRGAATDGPTLANGNTMVVPFTSPISGTPVPFPGQPGQVADRAYVGDADGSLWRVDFSSPRPDEWKVQLAWDAYSFSSDTAATADPIQTIPVISTDPAGNAVILFSTGDQEAFTGSSSQTRLWSILERPVGGGFQTSENWVVPFTGGARVTGPIALYNGVVYFSTFVPTVNAQDVCAIGGSSIWAVDYVKADPNGKPTPSSGLPVNNVSSGLGPFPLPQYVPNPNTNPTQKVHYIDFPDTIIFGVATAQVPNCNDTVCGSDAFFGTACGVGSVSRASTEIVFLTGVNKPSNSPSIYTTQLGNGGPTIHHMPVPQPAQITRVDSWASVLE